MQVEQGRHQERPRQAGFAPVALAQDRQLAWVDHDLARHALRPAGIRLLRPVPGDVHVPMHFRQEQGIGPSIARLILQARHHRRHLGRGRAGFKAGGGACGWGHPQQTGVEPGIEFMAPADDGAGKPLQDQDGAENQAGPEVNGADERFHVANDNLNENDSRSCVIT